MEEGFVLDRGIHDQRSQEEWWEGKPLRSFWSGIKKPERTYKAPTLRCTRCGYLMEFATADEERMR
jgi:hypothetical protein